MYFADCSVEEPLGMEDKRIPDDHITASSVYQIIPVTDLETQATPCTITQEPDPQTGRYRWLIQAVDPCGCTEIGMGGFSTFVPYRPYEVTYYDTFLISSDPEEIQQWLNCTGKLSASVPLECKRGSITVQYLCIYSSGDSSCSVEGPLGMEDGRIPDERITASSFWANRADHAPTRARLNTQGYAAAWCNDDSTDNISPWIQVDFNGTVTITGLITQGRGDNDQRVTEYQVTYSNDRQSWDHVSDADGTPMKFPGNNDMNTLVTTRFPFALRTRFLRIHPIAWNEHCSMRRQSFWTGLIKVDDIVFTLADLTSWSPP
ncbi:lactadherin-like [Patiria miniata]|uniref:F5/8 type C domain-containing protein n=1 Tax=Patiria miniata TaxID=46514 RepID=A0A914AAS8_PATMI|nr:lactadherin-like [Patiria miniata]